MEAHKEQELHWGWFVAFFILIVVLLFAFGDLLTAILGILIIGGGFASYHNELHKEL
ncbi:MAG: hypothetical protein MUE30_02510 [Spirosomaceae bacterium]|jgi:hypothetical protein|nr:hypothetical protein [Spirosomataceae bacterium]